MIRYIALLGSRSARDFGRGHLDGDVAVCNEKDCRSGERNAVLANTRQVSGHSYASIAYGKSAPNHVQRSRRPETWG